jgi:hypothetical protein
LLKTGGYAKKTPDMDPAPERNTLVFTSYYFVKYFSNKGFERSAPFPEHRGFLLAHIIVDVALHTGNPACPS